MTAETLSFWVSDPDTRARYAEAFAQSSFDGMLAYYKQNYPRAGTNTPAPPPAPQLDVPLLVFHGLKDTALHSDGLNNTWDWNDGDTTIVTAPNANHFVQQDAAELELEREKLESKERIEAAGLTLEEQALIAKTQTSQQKMDVDTQLQGFKLGRELGKDADEGSRRDEKKKDE